MKKAYEASSQNAPDKLGSQKFIFCLHASAYVRKIELFHFGLLRMLRHSHTFYFRGFVDLVILLSLLSSYVVFVLKVAWLAHVTLRKNNKTQAAVAPLYFGSRHAHNTRKESTDSSRRNVTGAILYCHRYKRSYDWRKIHACLYLKNFIGILNPAPPTKLKKFSWLF